MTTSYVRAKLYWAPLKADSTVMMIQGELDTGTRNLFKVATCMVFLGEINAAVCKFGAKESEIWAWDGADFSAVEQNCDGMMERRRNGM